jgi:hypothetical protein
VIRASDEDEPEDGDEEERAELWSRISDAIDRIEARLDALEKRRAADRALASLEDAIERGVAFNDLCDDDNSKRVH